MSSFASRKFLKYLDSLAEPLIRRVTVIAQNTL